MKRKVWLGGAVALMVLFVQAAENARPADFDAYWDGEIARQKREVPLQTAHVKRVFVPTGRKGFRTEEVSVPTLSDKPATGLLTIPEGAAAKSLAIVVTTCGAGTKALSPRFYARAIHLVLSPYGEAPRGSNEYYAKVFSTTLADYPHQGWESRDTCWFHGQILRLVRALEWIKTLPEWNGRDLIVEGKSMGGSQAIQAAALDPDVTVCAPGDPALCDHLGMRANPPRSPGWPQILGWARSKGKTGAALEPYLRTVGYYDNCHFASRIACRALFASGGKDLTCPQAGVLRAYEAVKGPKELTVDPEKGHCGTANRPLQELLASLMKPLR